MRVKEIKLPKHLRDYIHTESIEFVIVLKDKSNKSSLYGLGVIASVLFIGFLIPTFVFTKSIVTGNLLVLNPEISQSTILILFSIILIINGLLILFIKWIVTSIVKNEGSIFVGTNRRIIQCLNGDIESTGWDELTGNSEINIENNSITFELRNKTLKQQDFGVPGFKLGEIVLSNIKKIMGAGNIQEVAKICKRRAEKNAFTTT